MDDKAKARLRAMADAVLPLADALMTEAHLHEDDPRIAYLACAAVIATLGQANGRTLEEVEMMVGAVWRFMADVERNADGGGR